MKSVFETILSEIRCAYLIVDQFFGIIAVGGDMAIFDHDVPTVGGSIFEVIPELVGNEVTLAEILAGRTPRLSLPYVNRTTPAGAIRYIDLLTLPHSDKVSGADGLLQLITDVTERSSIEQKRVQQRNELRLLQDRVIEQNIDLARTNAELRLANQLKDEFLAGISHEVRTPLTAILGLSQLLRIGVAGELNDEQTDMIRRIDESGNHLLAVINDLLDLAKIDAGRFDLDLNTVSVRQICDSSIRMINELAIRKGQTVDVKSDPQVMALRADERRLRQVLINLLSNAVKFTPYGGSIGLIVQGDDDHETVRFTVWDTGIGIAPEHTARLFQPFSQIEGEHQRDQTGSGLGLVMVARLAELHGGGVALESELNQGSRFTISLPWSLEEQDSLMQALAGMSVGNLADQEKLELFLPQSGRNESILLVEDDLTSARIVIECLTHAGYRMTHVVSGDEALAWSRKETPQLFVVDLRMRGMDGLETIRRIRANYATRVTPIIVLTALAMPGDRERSLKAGANVYLSKPVQLRRLVEITTALLHEHERGN